MAFAAFADAPVDVAVVEVGMGGRWDATNVIDAPVAVITPIGIDHVEYLGDDIAGIAGEKAGIITKAARRVHRDTVAVIARQAPEAMEVLLAQTVRADAAVAREDSEFAVLGRQVAIGGQVLQLQGLGGVYSDIFLPLHGEHQAHNAAVALAAVEAFFGAGAQRQLDVDAVRAGFAAVTSPGRLERMRSAPTVFIDAAHNPAGAAALAQTLADEFDFRYLVGVLSVMADKDVDRHPRRAGAGVRPVVVTHNGSPRALDVESLALAAPRSGSDRTGCFRAENLRDAIETATALVDDATSDGKPKPSPAPGSSSPVRSSLPGRPAPCSVVIRNDRRRPARPPADPWKSFGAVMAATLLLEAIVVLLAIPVVGAVGGGLTPVSLGYLIGLAALLILLGRAAAQTLGDLGEPAVSRCSCSPASPCTRVWDSSGCCSPDVWALIAYLRAEVRRRQRQGGRPAQPPD